MKGERENLFVFFAQYLFFCNNDKKYMFFHPHLVAVLQEPSPFAAAAARGGGGPAPWSLMCSRASTRTRQIGHFAPPALRSSEAQGPHMHLCREREEGFFFFYGKVEE